MPARRVKSGGLMEMALAVGNPDAYAVQQSSDDTRTPSWGEAVAGLLFKKDDKDNEEKDRRAKFGQHSNSVRSLEYSQEDVLGILDDHEEFERLKAALKKKGAITNEVLKQRFHFYVQAKKDRDAGALPDKSVRQRVQRSQSDAGYKVRGEKVQSASNGLQLMRSAIHDNIDCGR
jgi:hypothetical protein